MKLAFKNTQQFQLRENIIITEVDGEAVLLNSTSGTYFGLNRMGTDILQCINNNHDVSSIEHRLKQQYPEHKQDIDSDLPELLNDLLAQDLIKLR
ncbi:MAG: PqqD family protein [Arenicella sp.]